MLTLHMSEEGGRFIARCPDFETLGSGETKQEAFACLCEAIRINSRFRKKHGLSSGDAQLVLSSPKEPAKWFGENTLSRNGVQ